ncbi:amino acid/amide ABC transporter ATP-binding protein 1 (HAAT family) [Actinomadura hallensis]|uniref:Amino acid/amide ABC transporter ATP-binding protein 1 (HAAT family) n=1 Tax=Actinomadura hallensis TaxID=337895 RepID=A0A543IGH1_9ACTN|nr:ABC transporter ATP-binding protein [Actinomadura hallensis]TQM69637.1 amino acid/amide ABC transporter ATP-binding protein 1 (HAAT family) [Actinomadura hallensis]
MGGKHLSEICLEISDVTVEFGGLQALQRVSAKVRPGTVLGIVGPNGAGKTTLFNVVSGVVRPTRGAVRLDGVDVTGLPPHLRARHGLSRTFQNLALNDEMTALENVLMGTQRRVPVSIGRLTWDVLTRKSAARETRARQDALRVMSTLGLLDDRDRLISELPFGTRRRVDMARALAGDPRTLLLDEPFSGLGDRERPLMSQIIHEIRKEGTVGMVLVEHDMTVVTELCDELLVLNEGVVLATGDPRSVLAEPAVQEAYLGPQLKRRRKVSA